MKSMRSTTLVAMGLLLAPVSCSQPKDEAQPEPAPASTAPVAPSASAAARVDPPPVPTVGLVAVERKELDADVTLFPVEGALLVSVGNRVGRLVDDKLEWVGEIPKEYPAFGQNVIDLVTGKYPGTIDVLFATNNGRAPAPTYVGLGDKGKSSTFSEGGGMGWISGVAYVGDTTLIHGYSNVEGHRIISVRGPNLERTPTSLKEAGCTAEEVIVNEFQPPPPAVEPYLFGSTRAGTIVAIGLLCRERGPAVEVWDPKGGKPQVHKLGEWIKDVGFLTKVLPGPGDDELFIAEEKNPIVRLDKGALTALPPLKRPLVEAFTGQDHTLFASDGKTLHRYDGKGWTPAAHLAWPMDFSSITFWDGVFWVTVGGSLYQLRETPSLDFQPGCKTPFVYLYDVSSQSEPTYSFPTTRKALATYGRLKEISLVEFTEPHRRLGITVPNAEVGGEVIAHIQANMKDESPRLICYAPKKVRAIKLDPAPAAPGSAQP